MTVINVKKEDHYKYRSGREAFCLRDGGQIFELQRGRLNDCRCFPRSSQKTRTLDTSITAVSVYSLALLANTLGSVGI